MMGAVKDFQMDLYAAEDLYEQVAGMVDGDEDAPAWVRIVAERAEAVLSQPSEQITWPELRLIRQALYEVVIGAELVSQAVKADERRLQNFLTGDPRR
jgi:hypothetical protein